jgi:hypothetical protein
LVKVAPALIIESAFEALKLAPDEST